MQGKCEQIKDFNAIPLNVKSTGSRINIYPNPATTEVKISSKKNLSLVKVVTLSGKVVLEQTLRSSSESLKFGNILQNGLYIFQFYDRSGRLAGVKKVTIVN